MKLFIPVPFEDWISDRTIAEIKRFSRHTIVENPSEADVIWLYARWIYNQLPINILLEKTVVTTVHHLVRDKGQTIKEYELFTDAYHVPCTKTEQAVSSQTQKNIHKLPYWINHYLFYPKHIAPSSKSKLILASFQRDTEGNTDGGFKPKLEKGPDIYIDIVNKFSEVDAEPLYPGWRRQYIKEKLSNRGLSSDSKLPFDALPKLYNKVAGASGYYLVTSRIEGGPQAILEAAATKTKILSTDVGVAKDVLHELCICGDPLDNNIVDVFYKKLIDDIVTPEIVDYNYDRVMTECNMQSLISKHDNMLESVYNSNNTK